MLFTILKPLCFFTHTGSSVPFPPASEENSFFTWNWDQVYNTGLDIHLDAGRLCHSGKLILTLSEDSGIRSAQLIDESENASRILGIWSAGTGRTAGGEIAIPWEGDCRKLLLRLEADLKKIAFRAPELAVGVDDEKPFLWPQPDNCTLLGSGRVLPGKIECSDPANPDECFAVRYLKERFAERGIPYSEGTPVRICSDARFEKERYDLRVAPDAIVLTAGARLPLLYAVESLVRLWENGSFGCWHISDQPYKEMRGFHFGLPPRKELDFAKRVFREILIPLHYNQIYVEFAGGMRFDSHPEISAAWLEGNQAGRSGKQPPFPHGGMVAGGELLEKEEVRDLLDYARELGFEIIPEVQSLSHVQYITYAHPELAERAQEDVVVLDTRSEDARPASVYSHCYCPSNPKSYELIYDLIDEIVDVARPQRYVHMGHDEVYQIGICPKCRDTDPALLYTRHVTAMHDYLAKKGLGMMIWSDMLQPTNYPHTCAARDLIPKDIVLLDFIWYFHFDMDLEENLLPYGFPVQIGNLYSSHFPRYEKRTKPEAVLGGEVSTWCRFDESTLMREGKFWDLIYTSQMLCSKDYREVLRIPYTRALAEQVQPELRRALHGIYHDFCPGEPLSVTQGNAVCDYRTGNTEMYPADSSQWTGDIRCSALRFNQAALSPLPRICWSPLQVIGKYIVEYTDGTSAEVPVEYGGGVLTLHKRYAEPLPQEYYRHQGYTGTWAADPVLVWSDNSGEPCLICGQYWLNPRPESAIHKVSFVPAEPYSGMLWVQKILPLR